MFQSSARAAPDAPSLTRSPALDRDEALRLAPRGPALDEMALEQIVPSPGAERQRMADLRDALRPVPVSQAMMQIRALEGYLDYDETDRIIYAPGRTQIFYGKFFLEADKIIFDTRLQEVQAEGDVILKIEEDTIHADSLRYQFDQGEGVAFNAWGDHSPIYFQTASARDPEAYELPQFRKVSQQESIFVDTNVTACDFKIPHYTIRGREIVLFQNDRIFFRGATLYIWDVPCFYLPVYTRSLTEGSPWYVQLGYGSRTGGRIRLGYAYRHRTLEPSLFDDDELEIRSEGKAQVYLDYLSKQGPGGGFDYKYNFEYNKHKGEFELYGLSDHGREVVGAQTFNESDRWRWLWRHRTELTDDLSVIVDIDEFSDPDIFYDVLDLFADDYSERDRQVMRRGRVALTWLHEAMVVRVMAEMKDRIGLDRYNDFSDPRDDNLDYNLDPYRTLKKNKGDGISKDRWGRVGSKLPQIDIATRHLPLGRRPLYLMTEGHLYYSLDKGINIVDDDDDAYVKGAEYYISLMHQWKLSPRYVILSQVGLGVGAAERDDDTDINYPAGFVAGDPTLGMIDGLMFVDNKGTFLTGRNKRTLDDIKSFYVWGDASVLLKARISDALTGQLEWRFRETTDDFIGDWYASLGSTTFREDLYDYKLREHWIEGSLRYRLARPLLTLYTRGGWNLLGNGDVYSKEPLGFWNAGVTWSNQIQTLVTGGNVGWQRRQIYDPSDVREYEEEVIFAGLRMTYSPIHQRWFFSLSGRYRNSLDGQSELNNDDKLTYFSDEDTDIDITAIFGRELGPKWDTELRVRWDQEVGGLREVSWLLQRDLHDATAVFRVTLENDDEDSDDRGESGGNQVDVRVGLKMKLPEQQVAFGPNQLRTVRQRSREPAVSY